MTKQQFLTALADKLNALDPVEREKILTFYAQMLDERIEDGMTEDAAVASMESLETITEEILAEHAIRVEDVPVEEQAVAEPKKKKSRKRWIIPVSIVGGILLFSLVSAVGGRIAFGFLNQNVAISVPDVLHEVGNEIREEIYDEIHDELADVTTSHSTNGTVAQYTFDTKTAGSLHVVWEMGNVYVSASADDQVHIHEEGSAELLQHPMVLTEATDGLHVRYADKTILQSLLHLDLGKDLYIELPAEQMQDVTIDADVGEVVVADVVLRNLEVSANVGEVDVRNVTAEFVDVDADMGQVTVQLNGAPRAIEVDTDMGEIELLLPAELGFALEAESDAGRVDINIPVEQKLQGDDRVYVAGDGACRIDLSADMGSIRVAHAN